MSFLSSPPGGEGERNRHWEVYVSADGRQPQQQAFPWRTDQVQAGGGSPRQRHRLAVRARPDDPAENRLLRPAVRNFLLLFHNKSPDMFQIKAEFILVGKKNQFQLHFNCLLNKFDLKAKSTK